MREEAPGPMTQEQIEAEYERAARWDASFAQKLQDGWIAEDDWRPTAPVYESADERDGGEGHGM